MTQQVLFFLSALGAFNGLLLATYLAAQKPKSLGNFVLSALLFVVSVRIGKSVLMYFSPEISKTILQIGLSACFFIGPLTCLYTTIIIKKHPRVPAFWKWQLIFLFAVTVIVGIWLPYEDYALLWGDYFYKAINWLWFIYLVFSIVWLYRALSGTTKFTHEQRLMLLSVNIGVAVIWLAYFTSSYTSYIVGALSFSFILYISVLVFLQYRKPEKNEKYQDKQIDSIVASELLNKLSTLMEQEKLYREPTINMPKLAKRMGVLSTQLSQLLNDNLNKSFATFINEYRIANARKLLLSGENLNMENIAEQCGYNSMSTFYSAFKKIEGVTPAKFRDKQINP